MHKIFQLLFILLLSNSAFLTGCGSAVPIIKPFKMDIQQGNAVTSKMLLQLKPGMSKSQVKFIMGSPLLLDSFHTNRWDYFYQMRQAGKIKEQRRVILEFENEQLARVRGDVVPEGTAGAAAGTEAGTVTLPKSVEPKPKEEGLLDKLKFWKSDETKSAVKPAAKEAAPIAEIKAEAPTVNVPSVDTPSVLAVPVPLVAPVSIGDAPKMPEISVPEVNPPEVVAPMMPEPKVEPIKAEPIKSEPPKVVSTNPTAIRPATSGEPFSFRMDRNLDLKNLEAAPVEVTPSVKPKKVEVAPPPPEAEPSYLEKMLEKIGF